MCKDGMLGKLKESQNTLSPKSTLFCNVDWISNRESNLLISGSATLRKNAQVQIFLFRNLYLNSQRSRRNSWHAGANWGHVSLYSTVTTCLWERFEETHHNYKYFACHGTGTNDKSWFIRIKQAFFGFTCPLKRKVTADR